MAQVAPEVIPLDRVEIGHILHQAELKVRAVEAHMAEASLDHDGAGIGNAQARIIGTTHLDSELANGLHGNKPCINPPEH